MMLKKEFHKLIMLIKNIYSKNIYPQMQLIKFIAVDFLYGILIIPQPYIKMEHK